MALRTVTIGAVEWTVWAVAPSRPLHAAIDFREKLKGGWLAMRSGNGERRRLIPIPDGWEGWPDERLRVAIGAAELVPVHGEVNFPDVN